MSTFIHLVADYGKSDPAFSEVVHRLRAGDPSLSVQTTAVPPFSTVATGFWIEQLGLYNPPFDGLTIYSNTAPRTTDETGRQSGDGGDLCYLELDNGVPVVAVDAGYNLAFVRDHVRAFHEVDVPQTESQFRSRDVFPDPVVDIANGDLDSLGPERPIRDLPPKPGPTVCHVDGYGNVKTTVRTSELDLDRTDVTVELNDRERAVNVRETVTEVPEGSVGLVPGSAGGDDPYLELFLRGGSAATAFGDPSPGDSISIQ